MCVCVCDCAWVSEYHSLHEQIHRTFSINLLLVRKSLHIFLHHRLAPTANSQQPQSTKFGRNRMFLRQVLVYCTITYLMITKLSHNLSRQPCHVILSRSAHNRITKNCHILLNLLIVMYITYIYAL